MPEFYSIVEIQEEWILEPEAMGTKRKFWYRRSSLDVDWLFKYPRRNTGEHWAEKIAAEVANLLGVTHARVELATFSGEEGSTSESFARGGRELIHGNQILAGALSDYDKEVKYGQSHHTLDNILLAIERTFLNPNTAEIVKRRFAELLTLDAVIGNTDRHHENWGLLRRRSGGGWTGMLAPSFDHASSLGRELADEGRRKRTRRRLLAEDSVGPEYVEEGRGGIFWSEKERPHVPSPLGLVRRAYKAYPTLFRTARQKIGRVDEALVRDIVEIIPERWMSPLERQFAVALMCYNMSELRKVFR